MGYRLGLEQDKFSGSLRGSLVGALATEMHAGSQSAGLHPHTHESLAEEEESEDEDELKHWEMQMRRLDYTRYTGLRRFQVRLWLLFEDSASSTTAVVVQTVLLLLIVLSTGLILFSSLTNCYFVADASTDEPCIINATHAPSTPCTRVCDKKEEFTLSNFVIEAICIGAFTFEFCARLFASPATVGLRNFCLSPTNWIDLLAIVPFYIELVFLISSGSSGSGANALAVLRIVRLTRVLRVVKKSKSLSGLLVLLRTLMKSFVAVLMIVTFAVLACVVCSSLMYSTPEVGDWRAYENSPTDGGNPKGFGMYFREDSSESPFSNMGEIWWWCIQTLTSEGYGAPWVPITWPGKMVGVMAALLGTIVLALPIAVIGMHFDDEWSRNRKEQRFDAASRVARYNMATQYGAHPHRLATQHTTRNVLGAALHRHHDEKDANLGNQVYNLQADLSNLLDDHFRGLRTRLDQTLDMHKDKLRRAIETDLKTVIRERKVSRARVKEVMTAQVSRHSSILEQSYADGSVPISEQDKVALRLHATACNSDYHESSAMEVNAKISNNVTAYLAPA
ncbi:hypothetical protein AB1Y20_010587 [Prymnesium parvum]|uniref:Ion transport domain-containing protein n=1 Tax=Prymnesium parvum TaxID=97485 RepID=A0AB34ISB1_PRYPA